MSIFETNLIVDLGVCLFFWFGFLYLTRDIKLIFHGTDNANLIEAAARSNEWKWPSDMHTKTYTGTSTSQRDLTVLLLALSQRIFRDKNGDFPLVVVWSFANTASVFLIYLIGCSYWNPDVALFISLLYLFSFWMWQMSLFVAHLNVGTMFFLLAVYLLTLISGAGPHLIYFRLNPPQSRRCRHR